MVELVQINPAAETGITELPRNVEAEAALLGALMIDNRIAEDVQLKLKPEHFFEPLHGRIYEAVMRLVERDMVANPVTLKPMLEQDPALKELGGVGYLAQLTGNGAALLGARDFAAQIYDLALLRQLVHVGRELVESALDTSEDVNPREQIEQAEVALYKVSEGEGETGSVKSFATATTMAVQIAERALNSGGHVSGITTGINSLNEKIGGMHNSDLMILAGRPGMGKTSLATNIAYNAASRWLRDNADGISPEKNMGAKTAFFSLEMSADQLATRVLAEQSGISGEALRMGKISRSDFQNLSRAARELQELPLFIDDTPGLTIAALRTRARRLNGGMTLVSSWSTISNCSRARARATIASTKFRKFPAASKPWPRNSTARFWRCPSSAAPSNSARTNGPNCPTFANQVPSSRMRTWSGSCSARIIMSPRRSRGTRRVPSIWNGRRRWSASTALPK